MAPPVNVTFDAIVIDPDSATKMRLKSAMSAVAQFNKICLCTDTNDAMSRLNSGTRADVVFIASSIDKPEVDKFIASAKAIPAGQDSAYVCTLKASMQDSKTIANSVIQGFDGILFEPYSVDQLVELTKLATKVKSERSSAREAVAFKMLLDDLTKQVNQTAFVKAQGLEPSGMMKKLRDSCATLAKLSAESVEHYLKVAVDIFENAPLPSSVFQKKIYGGASKRLQKKQKTDLEEEIKKMDGSSTPS